MRFQRPVHSSPADVIQTRYKPYTGYKGSGVEWLGDIPAHWEVRRLKTVTSVQLSNVDKKSLDGEIPVRLCNYTDVYNNERITRSMDFMPATATQDQARRFSLRAGDVLITKDSESWTDIAVPAVVDEDLPGVLCGYHLALVRPQSDRCHGAFLARAFSAIGVRDQFHVAANGITRFGLGWDAINASVFPIPPMEEQRAIASFLTRTTAHVDELLARKERLIDLLQEKRAAMITRAVTKGLDQSIPMKDSGIDWLADIPSHWTVARLKTVSVLQTGITLGKRYDRSPLETRPYLRVANVQDGHVDLTDVATLDLPPEDALRYELQAGDVLMTEGGDFDKLGRGYVWNGQIAKCLHQNHIFVVRPTLTRLYPHFLSAVLGSAYGRAYFTATSKQSTNLASTNGATLMRFPVPLPPHHEQQDILRHVEAEAARIDRLLQHISAAIERLKERRTVLISAVVTGKIDVRAA